MNFRTFPFFMKEEREIRFIIRTNIVNIIEAIEKAGFKKQGALMIEDRYYDENNYRLVKNKEGYRCRTIMRNGEMMKTLSHKKKIKDTVYENNLNVEDFYEQTKGKKKIIIIKKQRRIFKNNGNEVAIDIVDDLGDFLEIECERDSPQRIFESISLNPEWVERTRLGMTEIWLQKYVRNEKLRKW